MAVVRRQTGRARKAGHDSELARISALVEQMKQDWDSQKQALEQKIEILETELDQTRKLAQARVAQPGEESQATSRRRMLKRLGVAAAGLAVASVAATGLAPEAADAASTTTMLINGSPVDPGPDGTLNLATGTTTLSGQTTGTSGMVLQVKNPFTSVVTPTASNPNPNDALVASSANGIAVIGTTTGGPLNSGVQGIQGSSSTIQAAVNAQVGVGSKGAGVIGASDTTNGVNGFSTANVGVLGFSTNGYGMVAQVGSNGTAITGAAPLLIVPEPQSGTPNISITHVKGELHVDSVANMYICTVGGSPAPLSPAQINKSYPHADAEDKARMAAGAPATFAKFLTAGGSGTPSGLVINLATPMRLVGAGNNAYNGTFPAAAAGSISYFPIAGFPILNGATTDQIPVNASGVVGVLIIINPAADGFATIYPAGAPVPSSSSINYPRGIISFASSSAVTVRLGPIPAPAYGQPANTPGVAITTQQACSIGFDVVAYIT